MGQERKISKGVMSGKVSLGSLDTVKVTSQRILTRG